MAVRISETTHRGGAALSLSTRALEMVITTSVGPRIISLRAARGRAGNLFHEFAPDEPRYHGLHLRGGHRLWHAPEDIVRSYQPDDDPVAIRRIPGGVALTQPPEPMTGLQKAIAVEAVPGAVKVTHVLSNRGLWPVECAPWAITMLRKDAYGVVPFLPKGDHAAGDLLPTYSLVPWSFTDLSLPVWDWHGDFIGVDVAKARAAQKLGLTAWPGWAACWIRGDVFVKYAPRVAGSFPDGGSRFEVFTNGSFLELETMGPLAAIAPGKSVRHVEYWTVLAGLPKPDRGRAFADRLAPAVKAWLANLR